MSSKDASPSKKVMVVVNLLFAYLLINAGFYIGTVLDRLTWELFGNPFRVEWAAQIILAPQAVAFGPIAVSLALLSKLIGPAGAGMLGLVAWLVLIVVQYVLLVCVARRLFCPCDSWRRRVWRIYLFVYSAVSAYGLFFVGRLT